MWLGETFHGVGDQDIESLILVGLLVPLDGQQRREGKKNEKKKKNLLWERKVSQELNPPCCLCSGS
jgi:hypothetical protein